LQNSPLESSCVVVTLIENYSTSKPLNFSPEKSQILSCDTLVANVDVSYILRIDTAELHRVYDNMLQRAQKCIDVQGDYFQHLL